MYRKQAETQKDCHIVQRTQLCRRDGPSLVGTHADSWARGFLWLPAVSPGGCRGTAAAAACLGTAGQSLAAFMWGLQALARVIQFLCCQKNGISW